jgi:O-antigen biosynthesis protein
MEAEIIVVDNNSNDGSKEFFQGRFEQVTFIWNNENVGFSRANNIGVRSAKGEFILFLNPDTIVPEDSLERCVRFLEENTNAGAVGIRMVDGSGKFLRESKRAFPSPLTSLYKLSGLTKLFPRSKTFARYHLGHLDEHENHEIDVLAGAFMMIRRKVLYEVGSFDEQFFMYGEDVDLSYRIQAAGYKNYYFAESTIIHFKGESTKKGSLNYVRLFYRAMSTFVRKHYGGSRAGVFNFLIQIAIWLRAILAAIGRLIKWIGMPALDAAIIFTSFYVVKLLWSEYVKREVDYSPNVIFIGFPVFTLIFLAASYYAGLYDNGFRQRRLNRSISVAFITLLSGYALLPESLRFSRGILVFGSALAYLLMSLMRVFLLRQNIIESGNEDDEHRQTVVVGTEEEFTRVLQLMNNAGMHERILGRVEVDDSYRGKSIGHTSQLKDLLRMYPIKEVVFCEGKLSFQKMINLLEVVPDTTRIRIHASGSEAIVGSDSKDVAGEFVSTTRRYKLESQINRRNKNLISVLLAVFFLFTFPIHFITQRRPLKFFANVFNVLFLRKTWVSYASLAQGLPKLRPGVLSTTGLPKHMNTLPEDSLYSSDAWYAKQYRVAVDLRLVFRGYKLLSQFCEGPC